MADENQAARKRLPDDSFESFRERIIARIRCPSVETSTDRQTAAPWPATFLDELDAIFAETRGLLMSPHTLAALKERIAYAIGAAQVTGELGDWVQVGSCDIGGGQWAVTVVDGVDRPSLTILAGSTMPPSPADRPLTKNGQ
jgi:hypothetical protein